MDSVLIGKVLRAAVVAVIAAGGWACQGGTRLSGAEPPRDVAADDTGPGSDLPDPAEVPGEFDDVAADDTRPGSDEAGADETDQPEAVGPECSPCRAMNGTECWHDLRCEAIPFWGESLAPPCYDDRGFSYWSVPPGVPWADCPTIIASTSPTLDEPPLWAGCRQRGMVDVCPSVEGIYATCPSEHWCGFAEFGIDARGCRLCGQCWPYREPIPACAVETLCRENPEAEACTDGA
ncbi:MAG: hypothetical protein QME96_10980 [Myxococcota bacterium]|nr:hypothetical protein [Myxococcota bacterium]